MTMQSYYAMTMPGVETVAFSEINARLDSAELLRFARGLVLFRSDTESSALLQLRTTEDVFVLIRHITHLGRTRDAMRVLYSATVQADVGQALDLWRRTRHGRAPSTWRVVSQKRGEHEFRRVDAGEAIEDALRRVLPRTFHHVEDGADLEFWIWINGSEALIGLRLSDATMRHRTYQVEHRPASLRATVAASLGWLSKPTASDRVLDGLCGTATVLIERAQLCGYEQLIGGDIRPEAIEVARRNSQAAGVNLSLHTWDARSLPLDTASVSRIITNLPFGKQIGDPEDNERLYPALASEFRRVLDPRGLLVVLTSADRLFQRVLDDGGWHTSKKVVVVLLGQPATMFVARPSE